MAKTIKRKTTQGKSYKGQKGGEVMIPSTIGAMAGAAIGGLAGLALGSETARKRLLLAKDKALKATETFLENIDSETEDLEQESTRVALKRNKTKK